MIICNACLSLNYFTLHKVHPCCCKCQNYTFYGQAVFHCVCVYDIFFFFFHSSVDGYFGCFHILAVVNSVAMHIRVHVSFQIMVFCRCVPNSGIAGSYSNSAFTLLRNLYTIFHSGCINLYSYKHHTNFPFSPHPCQHLPAYLFAFSHTTQHSES